MALEPSRPLWLVPCRRGARLSAERWTDGRNQEPRITRTKKKLHSAAARIGVVCITSGSDSREGALSNGGAQVELSSVGGVNSGHEPSVQATFRCRALGLSDQVGVRLAHRGSLARRRVSGVRRDGSGTVDVPGWYTASAIIRSSVSITRVVGLVSNGVLRSPEWVAAVGGVAIAPLGG